MPLLTTLGASTAKAFKASLRPATIWLDNGIPAQGVVFNLQGDSLYHNYEDGIDLGYYTGPVYNVDNDGLWRRVYNGADLTNTFGTNDPARVFVNGYFNINGQGNKWYYNGAAADGYIQNLAQYEIYPVTYEDIHNPISTLENWYKFLNGASLGLIAGVHNVDGQGDRYYKNGVLFTGQAISSDSLWHSYTYGEDLGILNNFEFTDSNSTAPAITFVNLVNGEVPTSIGTTSADVYIGAVPILVNKGETFTGKYYVFSSTLASNEFRTYLGHLDRQYYGGAFEFNGGIVTGTLYGWHQTVNGVYIGETVYYRDGAELDNILFEVDGTLYSTYLFYSYAYIVTTELLTNTYNTAYSNPDLLLPANSTQGKKAYLVKNGQLASAGCEVYNNTYYCIGDYGEATGYTYSPDCSDCTPITW